MRIIASLMLAAWPAVASAQGGYLQGPPEGQTGCYQLDRNAGRTASIVREGRGNATITRSVTLDDGTPAFETVLTSTYKLLLLGEQATTVRIWVPEEFFTPEFLPRLRETRTYATQDFNAEHLGIESVTTLAGVTYRDADRVRIYDINMTRSEGLEDTLKSLARAQAEERGLPVDELEAEIKNLTIWAHIKEGVPALGAARLDLQGETLGVSFRAGIDVTADTSFCR